MPTNVLMPALSPTMEEGNLAKWHVKPGDRVRSGDVIAEIETDKATMEVEAAEEGTVGRLLVPEGQQGVKVNTVIAVLLGEGEKDVEAAGAAAPRAAKAPAVKAEAPAAQPTAMAAPVPAAAIRDGAPSAPNGGDGRVFASPLARRLAREGGIDLAGIAGSGPHGRIVKADLAAAAPAPAGAAKRTPTPQQQEAAKAPSPVPAAKAPPAAGPGDEAIVRLYEPGTFEVRPHDGVRRIIARRLTESKQTVPHFYLTVDTEIDALLALRAQINEAAPAAADGAPAWKVSVNDLVIKALALALKAVPDANATWTEGGMLIHRHADIGVAVSIPGGLITPVLRRAETKRVSEISNEMKDLAKRARDRKLLPAEYQGGSTTISNLGMYGVRDFAAVINPPHSSILAVGAGEQRPVVRNGELAVATVMSVTLSTDHRAVDGVLGAELLAAFKRFIEKPAGMLA